MLSRITRLAALISITILGLGLVYVFNEEKTYPEYWFQKRLTVYSRSQAVDDKDKLVADTLVRYKFYYDGDIDLAIEMSNRGNLQLLQGGWNMGSIPKINRSIHINSSEFRRLARSFTNQWSSSEMHDIDNHFGGRYAELELVDINQPKKTITVGYYNTMPNPLFINFKEDIIRVAEKAMQK
jgi:hypothetical protein